MPSITFEFDMDKIEKELGDESKPWAKHFKWLEEKSNLPKTYIFFGLAGFTALYLAFGYAAQILCNIIGMVYPSYMSMKAIESNEKCDDTKWLTYWVLSGTFLTLEFFSLYITRLIPYYWLIKCLFLIWCMAPIKNNGSVVMYSRVIRPYFLKHEATVDDFIDNASDKLKQGAKDLLKKNNFE